MVWENHKRREKEKKNKQKEKKNMSHQFVGKTHIFFDTSKQEGEKGEPVFCKKKPKGRVTKKKNEKLFFKTKKKRTDKM